MRISSLQVRIEEKRRYFHKLEGSRGPVWEEVESFVEVMKCSEENLDSFGVSELEIEELKEVARSI